MRRSQSEMNHTRILQLVPDLASLPVGTSRRFASHGYMDLIVEVIERGQDQDTPFSVISLAHYHEQNGDLMADPEMAVKVYLDPKWPKADALHYQNDGAGAFITSYGEVDGKQVIYPQARKDNNAFLSTWLRNLREQGHKAVLA